MNNNKLINNHTSNQQAPPCKDWHPADIKAALNKCGWTFARIAREYGYSITSPNQVLRTPWATMEEIVSRIIETPAHQIWPSRYDSHGRPLKTKSHVVRVPERQLVCNG